MNEEDISILLANVRETSNKSISYTRTQNSHLFTPQYPVTNTIYDWLWNDLEKLKLVSGRFDNRT
jgi:translation elongation factor EF-4